MLRSSSGAFKDGSRPRGNHRRCGDNGIAARVSPFRTPITVMWKESVYSPGPVIENRNLISVCAACGVGTGGTNQDRDGSLGRKGSRYERVKVT